MQQYCNLDIYHGLQRECDPEHYFKWIREEIVGSIAEYNEELAEEVEEWIDCTEGYLRRYMKFASGCMSDAELYKFYNDIIKMLDRGIEARWSQKSLVVDELERAEEEYSMGYISDEEYEEIQWVAERTFEALDEDIEILKELRDFCVKVKDKFDVIMCIEKVTNTAHSRGSMLPVMCGAYLPEDIIESVTGREVEHEYARPEDAGLWLSRETVKVLDCIKEFKPS